MADMMQWFAVGCPSCSIHLQVKLPEGITSVQCSECKAVFAVQIQPATLASVPQSGSSKKSRKRSSTDKDDKKAPPRPLSAYNLFMKTEVAKVKAEHPELVHRDAFKMSAERWQMSPMNPQNGGERFPSAGAAATVVAAAGAAAETEAGDAADAETSTTGGAAASSVEVVDIDGE